MIAPSINLDYEVDLNNRSKSFARYLLCDPRFGFKDGLHEPQKLLLIGFLYCRYEDELEHLDNLWHLINPNFKQKVSLRVIKNMLEDLLFVSIDQRLRFIELDIDVPSEQKDYLKKCM